MTIDYKKLLPSSMRTTRWGQFMEAIQSVLADIKTDKIEVIENQWNINEVTATQIKIIRDILGYDFLDYDSGWSSNLEYLKRQILTVVPRIENRTTKKAYDYDFYIYNLIGNAYPMYYDEVNKYLHPKTTWQTYDETADDTIIDTLDMVGPTTTQTVNTYTQTFCDDWYLPSLDELQLMYDNLASSGIAGFSSVPYWSSSESGITHAYTINMGNGISSGILKNSTVPYTRSARSFTSTTFYTVGGLGQGGYVFYKNGNNYIECSSSDQATGEIWSNINKKTDVVSSIVEQSGPNISNLQTFRFDYDSYTWSLLGNQSEDTEASSTTPQNITNLSYSGIALYNEIDIGGGDFQYKLTTHSFDNTNWFETYSGVVITPISSSVNAAITTLSPTRVCSMESDENNLKVFDFNGTEWVKTGNDYTIDPNYSPVSISALNSTDISYIDSSNKKLTCYRFDGADWSQVGSQLTIVDSNMIYPIITTLNESSIALANSYSSANNSKITTYNFNGTTWSKVGNSKEFNSGVSDYRFSLCALSSTDVVIQYNLFKPGIGYDIIFATYRFDGTNWGQLGSDSTININNYYAIGITPIYLNLLCNTNTIIGTGEDNTLKITDQSGCVSGAAKTVGDYENVASTSVDSTITINSYTLDTAIFPHLDLKHEIDRFTRHLLIPYEFRNIDKAGYFQTEDTLTCLYEDILYTKKTTEIPHFEPICKANIISGVASTKEYYFDYDVSVSGIVESYYYDSVYTDRLSGIAGIQFGTGSHSAVVVSGVTGVKTPLVYSGLVNGILWESDLDTITETATRYNARRNIKQNESFASYTEVALLDINSGVVAYATFPQITYLANKSKFYGNPQIDFNLV